MKEWGESKPDGYFVFTSNVDGHWKKAGVPAEKLIECHGTVDYLQCTENCTEDIWPSYETLKGIVVDPETFRAKDPLPQCKNCNELARTNVLMFNDGTFNDNRLNVQMESLKKWRASMRDKSMATSSKFKLAVIEVGAGKAVPTVRFQSEGMCQQFDASLIRINLRDSDFPVNMKGGPHFSLPLGGLQALQLLNKLIKKA